MAHLMKFYLLQWEVMKVKFLINSNMTLTVLNLHQKRDPKVQQDFIGQGPQPYGFQDIARTRFYRSRSLRQVQRSNQGQIMTLHNYIPNQCPYQVSTSYTLRFPRYSPDKIFELKVTTARSKVKSRSDHDVAHLHILTNVPTKYKHPTPYGFRDIARITFYRSRSLWQGQRSNQGQTMTLHTYTP